MQMNRTYGKSPDRKGVSNSLVMALENFTYLPVRAECIDGMAFVILVHS